MILKCQVQAIKVNLKQPEVVTRNQVFVVHSLFVLQSGYTSVNQGLPDSRTVKTSSTTVINSAHVTGDIGYQPTKWLKWKGKTSITQTKLQVQSAMHCITTR